MLVRSTRINSSFLFRRRKKFKPRQNTFWLTHDPGVDNVKIVTRRGSECINTSHVTLA